MKDKKLLGNGILLFTSFIWGMAFAFQSQAAAVLGAFTISAARMTLAAIEVGILCLILDRKKKAAVSEKTNCCTEQMQRQYRRNTVKGGLICGTFMGIATVLQQIGLTYTSAGKAGFITALYILFVPIFGAIFFRKHITGKTRIAVIIAIGGMYLLTMGSAEGIGRGDGYVFGCAVFFALQILAADIYTPKADPIKMAEIEFILIAVVSWVFAFVWEEPRISDIREAILPILYCGCISGGAGYTLQMVGQKYADPTPASLCMSFESVFSVVGQAVILHEILSGRELLGCIIMFAAIILVQLPERRNS
jgi:drug/metabolite transporter (DMT)-like permease